MFPSSKSFGVESGPRLYPYTPAPSSPSHRLSHDPLKPVWNCGYCDAQSSWGGKLVWPWERIWFLLDGWFTTQGCQVHSLAGCVAEGNLSVDVKMATVKVSDEAVTAQVSLLGLVFGRLVRQMREIVEQVQDGVASLAMASHEMTAQTAMSDTVSGRPPRAAQRRRPIRTASTMPAMMHSA